MVGNIFCEMSDTRCFDSNRKEVYDTDQLIFACGVPNQKQRCPASTPKHNAVRSFELPILDHSKNFVNVGCVMCIAGSAARRAWDRQCVPGDGHRRGGRGRVERGQHLREEVVQVAAGVYVCYYIAVSGYRARNWDVKMYIFWQRYKLLFCRWPMTDQQRYQCECDVHLYFSSRNWTEDRNNDSFADAPLPPPSNLLVSLQPLSVWGTEAKKRAVTRRHPEHKTRTMHHCAVHWTVALFQISSLDTIFFAEWKTDNHPPT